MKLELLDLSLPAPQIVRRLALDLLEQARAAMTRFGSSDPEALHDFRVALRRLRSLLQAHASAIDPEARSSALARLGRIGEITGPGRDAEALLEWIDPKLRSRSRRLSAARKYLMHELETRRDYGLARAASLATLELTSLWSELCDVLVGHRANGPAPAGAQPSFGYQSGVLVARAHAELVRDLQRVHDLSHEEIMHEARIDAKRLRYLLEPLDAGPIVRTLRKLQDLLGELNDLRALTALLRALGERAALGRWQSRLALVERGDLEPQRAARSLLLEDGLIAAASSVRARRLELYAELRVDWLEDRATRLGVELAPLLERLAELPSAVAIVQPSVAPSPELTPEVTPTPDATN